MIFFFFFFLVVRFAILLAHRNLKLEMRKGFSGPATGSLVMTVALYVVKHKACMTAVDPPAVP